MNLIQDACPNSRNWVNDQTCSPDGTCNFPYLIRTDDKHEQNLLGPGVEIENSFWGRTTMKTCIEKFKKNGNLIDNDQKVDTSKGGFGSYGVFAMGNFRRLDGSAPFRVRYRDPSSADIRSLCTFSPDISAFAKYKLVMMPSFCVDRVEGSKGDDCKKMFTDESFWPSITS